jgi:hypothetical protein
MSNTSATGGLLTPTSSAPLEDDALTAIFQTLIVGITGLDGSMVRPRWQLTPPKQPPASVDWCAIGVTDQDPDDGPAIIHDGAANGGIGQDLMQRHMSVEVLVSFYGPNSGGYVSAVRDNMAVPQNSEVLQTNLIDFTKSGTIKVIPELVNEQWVRRRDIPLYFRRQVVRTYAVENIISGVTSVTTN